VVDVLVSGEKFVNFTALINTPFSHCFPLVMWESSMEARIEQIVPPSSIFISLKLWLNNSYKTSLLLALVYPIL